ncbi:hypothetical protein F383_13919 [Gossypium arboreum]|uniref:Uncharacterized protein n=1 Tax=Gossypium arboreum TaxID=29729 RepID=A0A0B0PWZ4_GOSAR|nr:hypothetical protein F383_13919 [Gossypium arboreum]
MKPSLQDMPQRTV